MLTFVGAERLIILDPLLISHMWYLHYNIFIGGQFAPEIETCLFYEVKKQWMHKQLLVQQVCCQINKIKYREKMTKYQT